MCITVVQPKTVKKKVARDVRAKIIKVILAYLVTGRGRWVSESGSYKVKV